MPAPGKAVRAVFLFALLVTLFISAGAAFLIGIGLSLLFGNPYLERSRRYVSPMLALSIAGLGAGMNLGTITRFGVGSAGYTAIEIAIAMTLGIWLGRALRTETNASLLLTSGVTICGGSAVAVVALTTGSKPQDISLAMAVLVLLNAVGIFLLPWLGHLAHFSDVQFGLWSALAITDTSSVVAAAMRYGSHAVEVATNVKLARAVWIIPIALVLKRIGSRGDRGEPTKRSFPWFIVWFLAFAAAVTEWPSLRPAGQVVFEVAKRLLVSTLFLMGSSLTRESLRQVGPRPLLQGSLLWGVITSTTFGAIYWGWIRT